MVLSFVKWCNDNQGYATFLLSILTILISIIAICVSINAARLPYKKKVLLGFSFTYIMNLKDYNRTVTKIHLNCTNIGNRAINIHTLAIGINKKDLQQIFSLDDGNVKQQTLMPSDIITFDYSFANVYTFLNEALKENSYNITLDTQLYIFARDTEGKTYRKKFEKVKDLLSYKK